ncbi:hypothetical protein QNI19_19755 [Cytophagaceae bacterium DM2B3-1]|uniref:DUF4375 domain-containing protein n=1 Tax=Xanthocytophaga flava TaxID=3048013 RepID=A0ABT7CQF0_9BACT|nr:hypothetical protein [Xanthocytophaga flavus]MDJ1473065.1 hypothetical protein [Xanthocytophaga flavus]MDJ1495185.1 hypothetical protein [Xanthocytophaga flavus]
MFLYKTKWTEAEIVTTFDGDDLIFETLDGEAKFVMRYLEFEELVRSLFDSCFTSKQCKYIQIVKEWNECIGFNGIKSESSVIEDIPDTIDALRTLDYEELVNKYYGMEKKDAEALIQFLTVYSSKGIKIYLD